MTLDVEGVVDGGVGKEKSLRGSSRFKTLHSSFALSNRQVRIFRPVVLPAAKIMVLGKSQLLQGSAVRWQFVGDEGIRNKALLFQQFAHQLQRCFLVSTGLDQDIQHFTLAVHRPPEVHPFAVDGDKHLIKVPPAVWSRACLSQVPGIGLPELQCPAPNGLVRNIDTTFSQQIFDIAKAKRKSEIQPDDMLNDLWRKSMAGIGCILNLTTLLCRLSPVTQLL